MLTLTPDQIAPGPDGVQKPLTPEQIAELPQHSVIAFYRNDEEIKGPGYRVIRAGGDGGAGSSGYMISDDRDWNMVANDWVGKGEGVALLVHSPELTTAEVRAAFALGAGVAAIQKLAEALRDGDGPDREAGQDDEMADWLDDYAERIIVRYDEHAGTDLARLGADHAHGDA